MMIQPKTNCPICGREITKANFKKHYEACTNPDSNLNLKKLLPKIIRNDLCCRFCHKECKNLNSLAQHECRCSKNPDRKDFDKFQKYINNETTEQRKERIKNSTNAIHLKYENGYIPPHKGRKKEITHVYEEHNKKEIQKWINYLSSNTFEIPSYTIMHTKHDGYNIISKMQYKIGNSIRVIYEHDFIANILLNNNLISSNSVHHIDKNRQNNSIFNLLIFQSQADHNRYHKSDYAYLIFDESTHLFRCELR